MNIYRELFSISFLFGRGGFLVGSGANYLRRVINRALNVVMDFELRRRKFCHFSYQAMLYCMVHLSELCSFIELNLPP